MQVVSNEREKRFSPNQRVADFSGWHCKRGHSRWGVALALVLLMGGIAPAGANGDRLYLDCPCKIESDGATLSITAGVRSFRSTRSGELRLRAEAQGGVWDVTVADSLAAGSTLEAATYAVSLAGLNFAAGPVGIDLVLYEQVNDDVLARDRVRMEMPVDLSIAFDVSDLDYLKDTDRDGVGDVNEGLEGTDPDDSESTPGPSTIDVMAMYSQTLADIYDGDPTTRIQHLFALANDICRNSDVHMRLRLVGLVEVGFDESTQGFRFDRDFRQAQAHRHGADLMVLFHSPGPDINYCNGRAPLGGRDGRGHFEFERERDHYASLIGNCSAFVLVHELGHRMGLGHAVWQAFNAPTGTWRWSRGHGVDYDFGTIMTYGPRNGPAARLLVFSNPLAECIGSLEEPKPCGIDGEETDGADAVATLNAVRFQIARFRKSLPDSDEDGFVDPVDRFPRDAGDWWDADSDGTGDNADSDDDNDGVIDADDAFPFDGSESADSDDDGTGDNADAFPSDPSETTDTDGDGVGDNADAFPDDPGESLDSDRDGVGDNADPWPQNPAESVDTDGDGIGDNADSDDDNDGFDDRLDAFPLDAGKSDLASYLFTGESEGDQAGEILSSAQQGDAASFLIGVPLHDAGGRENTGAVYLVAASDLAALDVADGRIDRAIGLGHVASGPNSWKFTGENGGDEAGRSVVSTGDMDGDGQTDVLIGAPYNGTRTGAAYFVSGADFDRADAADGVADGTIDLGSIAAQPGSWKLLGEAHRDEAGISVAAVSDTDGDGRNELLIGAWGHDPGARPRAGAAYVVASSDLASADAADGSQDGVIRLDHAAGQGASWKLVGESAEDRAGAPVASLGDVGGDGHVDIGVTSKYRTAERSSPAGAVYLISTLDLALADAADGEIDRSVELAHVASQPGSWKLYNGYTRHWAGRRLTIVNDGMSPTPWLALATQIVSTTALTPADAADGDADGVVDLGRLSARRDSWRLRTDPVAVLGDTDGDGDDEFLAVARTGLTRLGFLFSLSSLVEAVLVTDGEVTGYGLNRAAGVRTMRGAAPIAQFTASPAGDLDGDGLSDSLLGAPGLAVQNRRGVVYLLLGADVPALDRLDGRIDDRLLLGNVAGDTDSDGILNTIDPDDDADGILDAADEFQLDPDEWTDSDGDGVGNNADAFPHDRSEWIDTDGDGLGDFHADDDDDGDGIADDEDSFPLDTDNDGTENADDSDDDGDGVSDIDDALPIDPAESKDTDGDGTGDNADTDDDNDGVSDLADAFPFDPAESVDTDGDGVGDNADAFPFDPAESADTDGDGTGDNADTDDDNDGVLDGADAFPTDAGASTDTDGDGVADSRDAFPSDAGESKDSDGDGVGDNTDTDDDNDRVDDSADLFPRDASRWDLTSMRLELAAPAYIGGTLEVGSAGDLDDDGRHEFLIAAPDAEGHPVVYVVDPAGLPDADGMDGVLDGSAQLHRVLDGTNSWKLAGEDGFATGTVLAPLGDLTGDGVGEFLIGASAQSSAGYVISGADLLAADSADLLADGVIDLARIAGQAASWKLQGYWGGGPLQASFPADIDADGSVEFAIGQAGTRSGDSPGTVQVISANALPMLDALHGGVDGTISMSRIEGHELWRLLGEAPGDGAGASVSITDFNSDGHPDLVVGATGNDALLLDEGAVYLIDGTDLLSADLADGSADGQVELARVANQPGSWKLVAELSGSHLGIEIAVGDLDGDKRPDLTFNSRESGASRLNVLSRVAESLAEMDAADGAADSVIVLTGTDFSGNVELTGFVSRLGSSFDLTDFDGDSQDDIVFLVFDRPDNMVAYFIASSAVFGGRAAATGSKLDVDEVFQRGGSYQIYAPEALSPARFTAIAAAGDVDADGLGDVLIAVHPYANLEQPVLVGGVAYLIVAADLPPLDAADGRIDGRIFLSNVGRGRTQSSGRADGSADLSGTASDGGCFVGLLVSPGESCTYPGTDEAFTVNVRGRGQFLTYLRGIRIDVSNETVDGQVFDFRASHQGDGVWLIERVAGSTDPP